MQWANDYTKQSMSAVFAVCWAFIRSYGDGSKLDQLRFVYFPASVCIYVGDIGVQ